VEKKIRKIIRWEKYNTEGIREELGTVVGLKLSEICRTMIPKVFSKKSLVRLPTNGGILSKILLTA